MKNPLWKIMTDGKEYLLMYCEKNTICKLCNESYQKIIKFEEQYNNGKKLTWFKMQNGYIATHMSHNDNNNNEPRKVYFIHQIIMERKRN